MTASYSRNVISKSAICVAAFTLVATTVQAQPPGGGDFFGGPPGFELATALDTDGDRTISAAEIKAATESLAKLDKNKDGKLSGEEIGWPPSFGRGFPGFGGGPPGGFGGGPPGGFGGRGFRGGGFGNAQGPPRRPDPESETSLNEPSRRTPASSSRRTLSAAQLKRADRNGDGKIAADELPKLIREAIMKRVDSNRDGFIDSSELDSINK